MNHEFSEFPQVVPAIESLIAEWAPEAPPRTVYFSEIGRAYVSKNQLFTSTQIQDFFEKVECIAAGDEPESTAILTGLMECLIHADSRGEFNMRSIWSNLGEATRKFCVAYDEFSQ